MALVDVFHNGSFMAGLCIRYKPLRQVNKAPIAIGSRVVAIGGASIITGGVRLEMSNVLHAFTIVEAPFGAGSATEKTFEWYAGGGDPVYPPDPKLVDGYLDTNASIGSPMGGAQRGDSARLSLSGFEDWPFVVATCKAFEGTEAADWGPTKPRDIRTFRTGGFFSPSQANLAIPGTDEHGRMVPPSTGNFVQEGSTPYAFIDQVGDIRVGTQFIPRPTIGNHQFWKNEELQELYFAPANDGASLTIRYGVVDKAGTYIGTFTESYTVATSPVNATGMAYTDWTGADTTSAKYRDTGTAVSPSPTATNSSGQLMLQLSGNDAGKYITIRALDNVPGDAPSNGVLIKCYPGLANDDAAHGYKSFGKKQDVVEILDDSGLLADRIGELEGLSVTFYWSDAVMMPVSSVQWRVPGGTWASVGTKGVDWCSNSGSGRIWISAAWFAGKPAQIEWRVPGAQMLDHRGFLPASVLNKIQSASDALKWVNSTWSFSAGAPFQDGYLATQQFLDDGPPACGPVSGSSTEITDFDDLPDVEPPYGPNYIQYGWDNVERVNFGAYKIQSQAFGPPSVLPRVPDGWSVPQAYCTLTGGNVTHVHDDWVTSPSTGIQTVNQSIDLGGTGFAVARTFPGGGYEIIAVSSAESGSTANNVLLDATNIVFAMYDDKDTGSNGYIIIPVVPGVLEGNLKDFVTANLPNPPGYGLISPPGLPEYCDVLAWQADAIGWGTFTLGVLWIKLEPAALSATDVLTERYPVLSL
jgi:hypothetical protein